MIFAKHKRIFEKDLYDKYAAYMFTVCYRYIGNREMAEELLNNGFIKVFKNYVRFEYRGKDSLFNWIKRIMINECLMVLRKKNNFELLQIEDLDDDNCLIDPEFDAENQILYS